MATIGRNENTQREFDNMIYRAKRWGLNEGQTKIWHGLAKWFSQNVDGPTKRELAEISGVSLSLVYWSLPVLEALKYITVQRKRNGWMISRSVRLWVYPESEKVESW